MRRLDAFHPATINGLMKELREGNQGTEFKKSEFGDRVNLPGEKCEEDREKVKQMAGMMEGLHARSSSHAMRPLHQIINYLKDKIGVVFFWSCVIFDTL